MASIAETNGMKGKAAKAPISTHPAFPFIVALWFAALLGMGSLVVSVELIGQIAVWTGLATIVPATAPPLGFTARALIALTFTGAGALAGLLIARQIAKAHKAEPVRTFNQHRPIDAHAELGAHGLDGFRPAIQPKGRRSLAIELDHGPSELLESAPLPGKRMDAGQSALEMLDLDAREFIPSAWTAEAGELDDDELELTEADLVADPAPDAMPGFQTFSDDSGDATMNDMMGNRPPFGMPQGNDRPAVPSPARQLFRAPPAAVFTPTWSNDEPEADTAPDPAPETAAPSAPGDEPLRFSAPSLARFDTPTADLDNDEGEEAEPMIASHAQFAAPPAEPAAGLEDMGLVQLAQRLGNSIERRRENLAARAQQDAVAAAAADAAIAAVPPLGEDIEVAAPDEAAQAMAAYFSRPAEPQPVAAAESAPVAIPTAYEQPAAAPVAARQMFQPVVDEAQPKPTLGYGDLPGLAQIGFDDEDEDEDEGISDLAASFSLPLGRQADAPQPAAIPQAFVAPQPATVEADAAPDYASLLPPRNPFQDQRAEAFVRIEDEPESTDAIGQTAVVFPVEAAAPSFAAPAAPFAAPPSVPVNNEENERALREALLSLQRMSGTA